MDFLIIGGLILAILYYNRDRLHRHAWSEWSRPVEEHSTTKAQWHCMRRCQKCGREEDRYIGQHTCSKMPCQHREQLDVLFHGMPGHVDFLEEELGLKND